VWYERGKEGRKEKKVLQQGRRIPCEKNDLSSGAEWGARGVAGTRNAHLRGETSSSDCYARPQLRRERNATDKRNLARCSILLL
jgi:hypothetical protein